MKKSERHKLIKRMIKEEKTEYTKRYSGLFKGTRHHCNTDNPLGTYVKLD